MESGKSIMRNAYVALWRLTWANLHASLKKLVENIAIILAIKL